MFVTFGSIYAQQKKDVVVAIAVKQMKCGQSTYSSHLGYTWWEGSDYSTCSNGAKKDIRDKFSGLYDDISIKSGFGNYVVILCSDTKYEGWNSKCDKNYYAVGVGKDAREAWERAKNDLPYNWKESDGYKTLVDRALY